MRQLPRRGRYIGSEGIAATSWELARAFEPYVWTTCKNLGGSAVVPGEMEGIAYVDASASARDDVFTATVGQHYPALVRRLTVVVGDRESALDLAQETYLRAYRAWDGFRGTDARAWVYTIGLRLAFNERDRRRRWGTLLNRHAHPESWVVPEDRGLHEALGGLRREHRAALLLSAVDGYTQAEIAAMLGVAPGTVASWLSRAKARMRKALTDA